MLLIFRLGRPEVLAIDDYGIRKGFAKLHKLAELPKPTSCWPLASAGPAPVFYYPR